jgi:type IV secretion system protein VirB11
VTHGFAPTSEGLLTPLTPWLNDPEVSEILLNKPQEIYVEKNGFFHGYSVDVYSEQTLNFLFQLIANENHQELTSRKPLLSGNLSDGSRIQLVLPPVAKFPSFAIRRKVKRNFSLDHYSNDNFYRQARIFTDKALTYQILSAEEKKLLQLYKNHQWDNFIRNAIRMKKNIVISGGTSSGKTTFLNACLSFISKQDRIITLEDSREIDIPHPNQVNLLAVKGEQGLAAVTMQDLVQCCLRLRPDRIIMGELRGKEISDFVSACSTGHEGSLTTIHANNPKIAFMRMLQMYKFNNVPSMSDQDILRELKEVVDIIVQINKSDTGRQVQSIYYKYGEIE